MLLLLTEQSSSSEILCRSLLTSSAFLSSDTADIVTASAPAAAGGRRISSKKDTGTSWRDKHSCRTCISHNLPCAAEPTSSQHRQDIGGVLSSADSHEHSHLPSDVSFCADTQDLVVERFGLCVQCNSRFEVLDRRQVDQLLSVYICRLFRPSQQDLANESLQQSGSGRIAVLDRSQQ